MDDKVLAPFYRVILEEFNKAGVEPTTRILRNALIFSRDFLLKNENDGTFAFTEVHARFNLEISKLNAIL